MARIPCLDCNHHNGDCDYRSDMGMEDDGSYSCPHWTPKVTFRMGVTRDERGIESQSAEDMADDRRAEKWDAEGDEQ